MMFAYSAFPSVRSTAPSDASMGPSASALLLARHKARLMSAVPPIPAAAGVPPVSRKAASSIKQRTASLSPMPVERSFASTRSLRESRP